MTQHYLIVDCFKNGQDDCQLNKSSSSKIEIQSFILPSHYIYHLSVNNFSHQSCSLVFKAANQELDANQLENIQLNIQSKNKTIYSDNLIQLFSEGIKLNQANQIFSELYRLDFFLDQSPAEFKISFDLDFIFDCEEIVAPTNEENNSDVLGIDAQREQTSALPNLLIDNSNNRSQFPLYFLIPIVLLLLFILILLIRRFRRLAKTREKLLISSKKGSL